MGNYESLDDKETGEIKVMPNSLQAEQAVLGSLMMDNNTWDVIADLITANDFYRPNHKLIFNAIGLLAATNQPFDLITLSEELKKTRDLDRVGGIPYLNLLTENTPTAANIVAYANIVAKKSLRRRMVRASVEIGELSHDMRMDNESVLEQAEKIFSDIAQSSTDKTDVVGIKSSLVSLVSRIEQRFETGNAMTGMPTGIIELDAITHGLQSKELTILAARPSVGKTAAMMRIVESVAMQQSNPNVLIFSLEMPESQLNERLVSSVGRIPLEKILTGNLDDNDWVRLTNTICTLSKAKIHYCDASTLSITEMRTIIRRTEREHGKLSLVAVDYLQLISEHGESQTHTISKISQGLKKIAKDFDVPMLALSQLNRSVEQRADKRPMLSDLRQSGQIEQDAAVIMFLYRDEVYNKDSNDKGIMEIIVGKNRHGATGIIRTAYLGEFTRVENLQRGHGGDNE